MRYSIQSRGRKYVKGYGFLLLGDKFGKKLIYTAIKAGIDAAKTERCTKNS